MPAVNETKRQSKKRLNAMKYNPKKFNKWKNLMQLFKC